MTTRSWIRKLFTRSSRTVRKAPARFRAAVEALEDRLAPANYTVNTLGDSSADTNTGTTGDLRYCITQANKLAEASTITIENSLFSSDPFDNTTPVIKLNGTQLPTITANVSIVGAADPVFFFFNGVGQSRGLVFTISGQNQSRVFQVGTTGTLSLNNLVIEEGATTCNGGGILAQGTLSLDHVTVTKNSAANGGGIDATGSAVVTITDSTITNNNASVSGGGVWFAPSTAGALTIDSSTVTKNTAAVSGGGVGTGASSGNFHHDSISNNTVTGPDNTLVSTLSNHINNFGGSAEGGGLDITGGSVSMTFCTIDSNVAQGGKGGPGGVGANGTSYTNSTADSSTDGANGGNGGNGAPGGAGGSAFGGGIAIVGGSLSISASTLSNNIAQGGVGGTGGTGGKAGDGQNGGDLGGIFSFHAGNGGSGGNGGNGGDGGAGGQALGGGLFEGLFTTGLRMTNTTVADNQASGGQGGISGKGGNGGNGALGGYGGLDLQGNPQYGSNGIGGNGGNGGTSGAPGLANGAGINIDSPTTSAVFASSTIASNNVARGPDASQEFKFNGIAYSSSFGVGGFGAVRNGLHSSDGRWGLPGEFGQAQSATGGGIGENPAAYAIASSFDVTLENSIVAANTQDSTIASDIYSTLTTPANSIANLIGTGGSGGLANGHAGNQVNVGDPGLLSLGNYGGETQTMALKLSSPAVDAGDNATAQAQGLTTDQRGSGFARLSGTKVDIGAFELQQSFVVTTLTDKLGSPDPGVGQGVSLREAIALANLRSTPQTITFAPALTGTITLSLGELSITKSMVINGPGANALTIDGNKQSRVFYINDGNGSSQSDVTIRGLSIINGQANTDAILGVAYEGGGIYDFEKLTLDAVVVSHNTAPTSGGGVFAWGPLTVTNSTVSNNNATAGSGGGIVGMALLTVTGSTISNNTATTGNAGGINAAGGLMLTGSTISKNSAVSGGGILSSGTTTATNSTIALNTASDKGGGIDITGSSSAALTNVTVATNQGPSGAGVYVESSSLTLANTIIADALGNSSSTITYHGGNLVKGLANAPQGVLTSDPLLGDLTDNGGSTQTMALLPGSPAINAGDNTYVPADIKTDQRGQTRIRGAAVDLGAFEVFGPAVVDTLADTFNGDYTPGHLSLREAIDVVQRGIADAAPITFTSGLHGTIALSQGPLAITSGLDIKGPGPGTLTVDGGGQSRVFSVSGGTSDNVTISGLTITGGSAATGGGIWNADTLLLSGVVVTKNSGGGIENHQGNLSVIDSTVSNNTSANTGGGIDLSVGGTLTAVNTTIADNTATYGGGIFSAGVLALTPGSQTVLAAVNLTNVTVAGNSASQGAGVFNGSLSTLTLGNTIIGEDIGPEVSNGSGAGTMAIGSVIAVQGQNLVQGGLTGFPDVLSDDPMLGQLQDNGGPTQTMALLEGSPAINAGDSTLLPDGTMTDQRGVGFPRIRGDGLDLGAYEFSAPPTVTSFTVPSGCTEGSPVNLSAAASDPDSSVLTYVWFVVRPNRTGFMLTGAQPSFTPADNGTYLIRLIVQDSDQFTSLTYETDAEVANVAPTAAITGSPASGHSPEGTAINLGSTVTDPSSVDTAAGFTYSWSVTKNGAAFASGSAANFTFTPNDNGTYVVSLTATDKDGGASPTVKTTIIADNVAPTAGVSGPGDAVRGQPRTFTISATDPSSVDQAAGFTFAITWGDGSSEIHRGLSGLALDHVYVATGTFTIKVTATDKDGGFSARFSKTVTVTMVKLQADVVDPTLTDLAVGGSSANDNITLSPADAAGNINVNVNGASLGNFKPTGHILIYGQAGNDVIQLASKKIKGTNYFITVPALIFGGGTGNENISVAGSTANNVVIGGGARNQITGGLGRDLLIAGSGKSALSAGSGDDILIGGWTAYDLASTALTYDLKLQALFAIMAEWGRTDADFGTRVSHLLGTQSGGLNGTAFLNAGTVLSNSVADTLNGSTSALDWFFADAQDVTKNKRNGEATTGL